jgi:hypothetical protein
MESPQAGPPMDPNTSEATQSSSTSPASRARHTAAPSPT